MNANYSTPARVKLSAFIGAVVASVVILGSTVAGMQPTDEFNGHLVAHGACRHHGRLKRDGDPLSAAR